MRSSLLLRNFLLVSLLPTFIFAFWRVHMRTEILNLGYKIGQLKQSEHQLIQKKTRLQYQLSMMLTKDALSERVAKNTELPDLTKDPAKKKAHL